jgi:hypothetical protein
MADGGVLDVFLASMDIGSPLHRHFVFFLSILIGASITASLRRDIYSAPRPASLAHSRTAPAFLNH